MRFRVSKFLHRREVALSAIHAEPSARQTVRTEGAQTIPDIAEDKPAPTHDESTVEASVEAAEAKAMRSLIERKEVSVDQKLEQQPDLPARTDSLFYNTHETRQAETVSIGDQLALLMHEAAKDMDSAELRSMINARDKQVSSLSLENEQLKRMQDEMMTKIELQTQRIFELRFANKAMKTVNRSLVEDAEAYHMLRSKQRKIFLPSQAPVIVDENGEEIVEGPAKDSAVASLDHSRNASPSISQRSSLDVEANEESSRQIISGTSQAT
ncbi:hypothetical protein DFJ77DRAFT_81476 [Powellomyces hirtus]|nr:hypothetical protein DFJ77DRAFT_81476 [Powellomyces hirtus]